MRLAASVWPLRWPSALSQWLERVDSFGDWAALSARPGHHTVARTETVKFIVDLHRDGRTYFINTKKWELHYDFVVRFLDPSAQSARFTILEYTSDDRRFMLGSLMHYLDGDHWTLELTGGDTLPPHRIALLFTHIAQRVGIAPTLKFRPVSPHQIDGVAGWGERIPLLHTDAINASVQYQPVVLGVAYGTLRLCPGPLDVSSIRPYDIVVTDHVPEAVPPVAGLVTSQLQAPLAHVAVLSRNRNTPDMALRGAIDLPTFRGLENRVVKLTVEGQEYRLEPAPREEAEVAWAAMRPATPFRPLRDLRPGLFDIDSLPDEAVSWVGAKAAQAACLCRLSGIQTPPGFALPFSAYAAHLESANLDKAIDAMLADRTFQEDASVRRDRLAELRSAIADHPVAPELMSGLVARLRRMSTTGRFILRSSTNAEDLDGFNGAGLYESVTVPADPSPEQVAQALRLVWASVWLQRAYEEREWYRVDHRSVAMGVLVQEFVEDAIATGVAITGNPFKQGLRAVFINTQAKGTTVTGALGNQLPEQYLVATWSGTHEPELLSRSSLTGGEAILELADLHGLTDQLLQIHREMLSTPSGGANAMDVEFALTTRRKFVMLQARPYTIVYGQGRQQRAPRRARFLARLMHRLRRIGHRLAGRRESLKTVGTGLSGTVDRTTPTAH